MMAKKRQQANEPLAVKRAIDVVAGMTPWFKIDPRRKPPKDGRTLQEAFFDSGVFAASELIRRLTGNEDLALAVHEACIWRQRERAGK